MDASNIVETLERCYLPKLAQNLEDHCGIHGEFEDWDNKLVENFPAVINLLNDFNLKGCSSPATVLSSLLLLYFQLHNEGRWSSKQRKECAEKLNWHFQILYESTFPNLLKSSKLCSAQEVFDKSMEILHQKLTPEDFKKYPALVEAYSSIVNDLKACDVTINPVFVIPVSLLLIEDYVNENKLKGLKSCLSILKCLTPEHFKEGNYYEVLHRVLKKLLLERDLEITKLVLENLTDVLNILPPNAKVSTIDETLGIVLDQIYTESNLYRKKAFFNFLNKIIHMHGVHCVKRNMFLLVIIDNLDICSNEAVREILLLDVLECFENWIQYCWCVWKLSPNKKVMSVLLKLFYIVREDDSVTTKIQEIFIALCKLSTEEEQKEISKSVGKLQDLSLNDTFSRKLHQIIISIS